MSSVAFVVGVTSTCAAWATGLPTTTSTTLCVSGCRPTTTTTAPVRDTTTTTSPSASTTAKPTTTTTAKPPPSGSGSNNTSTGAAPSGSSASNSGGLADLGGGQATNSSAGGFAPTFSPAGPVVVSPPVAARVPVGITPGPRSTVELLSLLSALRLPIQAQTRIVAPFPVVGPASYGAPTPTGASPLLSDQGTDIAAVAGSPVVASGSGVVAVSGETVTLTGADGTAYSYAGLAQVAVTDGSRAAQGDVIGVTGDPAAQHLHFSIRPQGGAAVDAAPYLDRWLAQALSTARAMGGAPLAASSLPTSGGQAIAGPAGTVLAAVPLRRPHSHPSSTGAASALLVAAGSGWWARRCWKRRPAGAGPP